MPIVFRLIARTLIAELPELGSLDRRQIAALVGLAPDNGAARALSAAVASVRNSFFVGAMVAARYNPQLKSFRQVRRGARTKADFNSAAIWGPPKYQVDT